MLGNATQADLAGGTGRTFRHHTAWCWNVAPVIERDGVIYDEVQLDGTYLADGWCLLVAIDGSSGNVIAIQWTDTEKHASWKALLERIAPPRVVVIDGGQGLLSALKDCWPEARIQRCLVHVRRNVHRQTTQNPRTDAGKALFRLASALTGIESQEQATTWLTTLNGWKAEYGHLLNAKTRATDRGAIRPAGTSAAATWWWTHARLRKGYGLLERLAKREHLFTFLEPELAQLGINRTTNKIEGGVNAPLKDLLRRHRGMPSSHQRRAADWWCYLHSPAPAPPSSLIRPKHWQPAEPVIVEQDEIPGDYGTATTAEEGLWARKGWAGRST